MILTLTDPFAPTADPTWIIEDLECDPLREPSRESRFAVSNGFLGVRSSRAINQDGRVVMPPRTYVAGLFDTIGPDAPISVLVPVANWLELHVSTDVDTADHDCPAISPKRLVLDMRRGTLITESFLANGENTAGVRIRTIHLVSLRRRAIGLQLLEARFEDAGVAIDLEAMVDQSHRSLVEGKFERNAVVWSTRASGKRLAMAVASSLKVNGVAAASKDAGDFASSWHWTTIAGQVVRFERIVALIRSDGDTSDVREDVLEALEDARSLGSEAIVKEHEAAWAARWYDSDVVVDGDEAAQRALRFAVYHLNSAVDPTDPRVSIGARALTGEDYHGHVFWDTEIYLVPFFVLTWPDAARALLTYRFRTLDGARAKAERLGFRGAFYAWESADTGDETAPEHAVGPDRKVVDILSGTEEQHISADIAYAVWQYWLATRDERFMLEAGAEMLFETARFWASRAVLEADGRHHIRNVIGPDEYHVHIDDNAFTNVMARWNIDRALDFSVLLRDRWPVRWRELSSRLGLTDSELEQWRDVGRSIVNGLRSDGMYEQFEGYFKLEDIDLSAYAGRSVPMDVVLGRERTQGSQVIKQADVVALLALLPEEFPESSASANFRYYERRCGQGSSLSRAMHAVVAARLGEPELAMKYFTDAAAIDLSDDRAATAGGIHIAAQGGVWLTAVYGFSGLSLREDGLALDPHMPVAWHDLTYRIQWRGRRILIHLDLLDGRIEATLEHGDPMAIFVEGRRYALRPEVPLRAPLAS